MDLFSNDIKIDSLENAVRLFQESREGFVTLFNNSPICMSMTTTNLGKRVYVRVNKKFLEKFGYEEREIIGRTSIEIGILDEEESARVRTLLANKGRLQNDYVKCRAKSGEIVHTVSSIEYMTMNGETHLVSFFVDITEVIKQQAIIEQHVQQLEVLNKELEAFSYTVSHDLRAPLRAIDGFISIIEEDFADQVNGEGKKLITAVQRNAKRMNTLIDDLLEFARMGKKPLEKTTIDMNKLVRDVLADLKAATNYTTEVKIGDLQTINGDHALMKQVMFNLISNAIKYSSKKEKPEVDISSKVEDGQVIFTVADNGAGFDMQYAQKLFGVFQRLHNNTEFEGTGVGLATVQRIIAKHGGTIHAYSERDNGAKFWFKLPVEKVMR